MRYKRFLFVALAATLLLGALSRPVAGDTHSDYVRLAGAYGPLPLGSATRGHPKLESVLNDLAQAYQLKASGPLSLAAEHDAVSKDGQMRVVVELDAGPVTDLAGLAALGGKEETRHGDLVQMQIPVTALADLADMPGVGFVRRPYPAQVLSPGAATMARPAAIASEGVAAIGANAWQAAGFRGQGAKVAVIDLGFAGFESALGADTPVNVETRSFRVDGDLAPSGERHGTAVAEIVHSVAPDAQLLLINFSTDVEWANAVDFAVAQGSTIISSSVGFLFGPFDGTGFFADKVTAAREAGVLWSQAAGNFATSHWGGSFSDANANGMLDFGPGLDLNSFSVPPNSLIEVVLSWADWPSSDQDYDLALFQQLGGEWVLVDESTNIQSGSQPPLEVTIGRSAAGGVFAAAVRRTSATRATPLHLYVPDFTPQVTVASSSLVIPADSPGALAVGAIRVASDDLEAFSSRGPTTDGRTKPDLAAPDGVSTESFGVRRFFGTSASAPHAAGAAALLKSANGALDAAGLQAILEQRAVDLGPAGKDNVFGAGRLNLGAPITAQPTSAVDAKIEIVFPHDQLGNPATVTTGSLANVGAFLFAAGSLRPVACTFEQPVRLLRALNTGIGEVVATGAARVTDRNGRAVTVWEFDDIDVGASADPLNKYYFLLSIDGVDASSNVWSHGADARTIFPQQDVPAGVAPVAAAVDAKIEIVFPHDAQGNPRSVTEAELVNVAVDVFQPGSLVSVPPEAELTVRLHRSLNNDVQQFVASGQKQVVNRGGFSQPRWVFNDVDVSASTDPLDKYYFTVTVDGLQTRSNVWSHGADARTIFPNQDLPSASCG